MQQFYRLILHNENQLYALQTADGKGYPHQRGFLPRELVEGHIEGSLTLGVRLLQPETNTAKAGCLDLDCPRDAATLLEALAIALRVQTTAKAHGLEAYLEFSGAKGFHIWLFVDQPIPGKTWIPALKKLAAAAGFEAKEVFPYSDLSERETKSIKLPGGIHRKSGKRCGFLPPEVEWVDGFPVVPPDQEQLMAGFVINSASAIAGLAALEEPNKSKTSPQPANTNAKFESFPPGEHPACIQYLLTHGAPADQEYNAVNLTIARYAISRGVGDDAAVKLGDRLARATSEAHPTSKDLNGKLANFRSAWSSAKRHPEQYQWGCPYVWASAELNRGGACIGKQCALHPDHTQHRTKPAGKPWNQMIWQSLHALAERGEEIRTSLILAELEKIDQPELLSWVATDADEAAERETLVFLLHHPEEGLPRALQLDILPSGFVSSSELGISEYLQALVKEQPCKLQTFERHLERIRDTGLRVTATKNAQQSTRALSDRTQPVPETLDQLLSESKKLLRRSSSEVEPMTAHTSALTADLFGRPDAAIATPSSWLNNTLNGGFAPGRLYVIGAPPGAGKSTFCSWCGDYAALGGLPVLYIAFEMSRIQLWVYCLSRLSGINSALIESKRWNDKTYHSRETLLTRVAEATDNYHKQIAPKFTILEAGAEHTPARLKGAIAQIRHGLKLDESDPVLVIVDYLQLMLSGDERLDTAAAETLRVSRIATSLKQLARDTNSAVIAISDITKAAYQEALKTGSLDMSALRDSFKIAHAADAIALLQTGKITVGKGNNISQMDQLQLSALKHPTKQRLIEQARLKYPLNEASSDTYSRLSILKNRGGMLSDPLFVYHKALHRFTPINLDLEENRDDESI